MTDALRTDPAPKAESPSGDPRADRVRAAVRTWQRTLVDLGGRKTLLWYRDLPSCTLDLTTAHPGGVAMLLAGRRTRLSDLVREPAAFEEARRRARAIRSKALELHEERGIAAGFIAIGMATWSVPRAARPPASPVLLRSCVLRTTGAAQEAFEIDLGPEAEFNPVLREYLRSEQGIEIDADALADLATAGNGFDPYPAYAALGHACERVPEFEISPRLVLGTFSYAKLPMVADLALQGEALANHDVVAALAGDESALAAVRLRLPESDPDPDPEHEYLVLDADSSQHAAIDAVRAGAHLVVKGPPGTGKSQTIVNLIASLAAEGKSTLFVAEKRAAIDAVLSRLDRLGLGDLVLDAYDGPTNKRATAQQFAKSLDAAVANDTSETDRTTATLRDRRARLQKHVEALHAVRDPWGVSAHEAQQALVELGTRTPPPTCHVRLGSRDLAGLSRPRAVELGRRLRDAAGLGAWTRDGDDPWFGARILTADDAARALDVTTRHSTSGLDEAARQLNRILSESHVPEANSLEDWKSAFATMSSVRETLEVFRPEVFDIPLKEHIAATATRDWREARDVDMGWLDRWKMRQQTKRLLRPGRPPPGRARRAHADVPAAARPAGPARRAREPTRPDRRAAPGHVGPRRAALDRARPGRRRPRGPRDPHRPGHGRGRARVVGLPRPGDHRPRPGVRRPRRRGTAPRRRGVRRGRPSPPVGDRRPGARRGRPQHPRGPRRPPGPRCARARRGRQGPPPQAAARPHAAGVVHADGDQAVLGDEPARRRVDAAAGALVRRRHLRRGLAGAARPGDLGHLPRPPGRRRRRRATAPADELLHRRLRRRVRCHRPRRRDPDRGLRVGARRARRGPADPQPDVALPQPRRTPHRLRQRHDVRRSTHDLSRHVARLGRHVRAGRRPGCRAAGRRHHRDDRRRGGPRRRARPRSCPHPSHGVARRHRPRHEARRPPRGGDHRGAAHRARRRRLLRRLPRRALLRQEPRARPGRRARRHHPVDRLRQDAARPGPAPLRPAQHRGR